MEADSPILPALVIADSPDPSVVTRLIGAVVGTNPRFAAEASRSITKASIRGSTRTRTKFNPLNQFAELRIDAPGLEFLQGSINVGDVVAEAALVSGKVDCQKC